MILFGLSMDYHVFIVSRIRERFQRGDSMDESISNGIRSTAGVVTSAAIVMVCVFAVFATLSMLFFKQFGVGLASAILIDATIVRGVLLPASMKLLGERNWYLPAWLEWLPHFDHGSLEILDEPEPEPEPATPPAPQAQADARVPRASSASLIVAVLAIGLAYLRFSPDGGAVSVPAGAKAGQLTLHPCHYGTEQGSYAADCGTLVVPENRARPALAADRTAGHPHPGQLGASGRARLPSRGRPRHHATCSSRRRAGSPSNHDVVLVGYRGVDGSVRLDCPEVASALKRSTDLLGQKSFRAYTDALPLVRDAARRRTASTSPATRSPQQVDDLEAARKALGYGPIDLISESAGTRTAMIYAWRYPKSIHRSVMIGVNPPGHFLWDPKTTDAQIRRYSRLCAQDPSCSERTDDLAASMRKTAPHMPDRFWGLPFDEGTPRASRRSTA